MHYRRLFAAGNVSIVKDDCSKVASQREVLVGLSGFVNENLDLLLPVDKAWQPTDYLPDLTGEDWREKLAAFREPAMQLSDEVLVVLVGDMVTEEALPSYAVQLNLIANDDTGIGNSPWARWSRGWVSEENRHGDLLNAFLRLTGRVDMRAIEVTIHNLIARGFDARAYPDIYAGLVYTSFQERATKISHNNLGRLAGTEGNTALCNICQRIAGDEARHESFYTRTMEKVFQQDPDGSMRTFANMLKRVIAMPGRLMCDGKDPDLFDHFAIVAQRVGVYTLMDYAAIIRHLVQIWSIETISVSGDTARDQEFLCRQARRVGVMAEHLGERLLSEPRVPFSWIHGRSA